MNTIFIKRLSSGFIFLFFLACIALGNTNAAVQQDEKEVTGTVLDENGKGLPGASVSIKGTTDGTITNLDGYYTLSVPNDAILEISFIGYLPEEIAVQNQDRIDVQLVVNLESLSEIVIIGYGEQRRKDVTGALEVVRSEEIDKRVSQNPLDNIQGKVAGVEIFNGSGRPGNDAVSAKIRGTSSLSGNNQPLYVIDGLIGADIRTINVNDIESISILKDASATAIYGFKGANGVIIVTTKKGKKGIQVDLSSSLQIGMLTRYPEVLNSDDYWNILKPALNQDRIDNFGLPATYYHDDYGEALPRLFNPDGSPRYDTDWIKETTRTAYSKQYHANIRAGGDNYSASFSVGSQKEDGILNETYADKNTIRFNGDYKINKWLKVGGSLSNGTTKANIIDDYRVGAEGLTFVMLLYLPVYPTEYEDGTPVNAEDLTNSLGSQDIYYGRTPKDRLKLIDNTFINQQIMQSYFAQFTILDGLKLKTTYSVQNADVENRQHIHQEMDTYLNVSEGWIIRNRSEYTQFENILTYNKELDNHTFGGMLGASWYKYERFNSTMRAMGFDDYYGINALQQGTFDAYITSSWVGRNENSYFARANYSYRDKYLLTATGRVDGSSRFGSNNQYAFFPSVAAGWTVSNEPFLARSSVVNNLKIRASYGVLGSDVIPDFQTISTPESGNVIFGDTRAVGNIPGVVGNESLKWEKTTEYNLGVNVGLWDVVSITADVFNRETQNLLDNVLIPRFSGYDGISSNVGSLRNRGIELMLSTNNIRQKDFAWTTDFNFYKIDNEILALGQDDSDQFFAIQWFIDGINRVGEPANSFYGYNRLGIYGTEEAEEAAVYGKIPGDIKYEDLNEDGNIGAEDRVILGKPNPDFEINLINTFSYKNWDLSVHIRLISGASIMDYSIPLNVDRAGYGNVYKEFFDQRWTPQNQNTMYPRIRRDVRAFDGADSGWIFDASFIRGQNLTLSYNLPTELLEKVNIASASFFANAQNFFLITDYHGYDPEVSSFRPDLPNDRTNSRLQGRELNGYPKPFLVNLGIKMSL